jgi:chromosome segregation ATPase
VSELRPEQKLTAVRLERSWDYHHRYNQLGTYLRRLAYQAERFDSTPSAEELGALSDAIAAAGHAIEDLVGELEAIAGHVEDLRDNVARLKAHKDAGLSEWQVFGLNDNEDLLDRLSRAYGIRPPGYRSENRLDP